MMKTYEELMAELDDSQRNASRIGMNAVIAAGAGSGKTRVLAARFVYLIIERKIPVDKILTLTFTKKAAAEMYTRIYSTLCLIDHPLAREAIASFHLARIDTIDAFCNSIARTSCRAYGISPDFEIDNDRATLLAEELALPFFLENRTSEAIRQFMKKYTLAELSPSLFADTMVRHSPVSSPLDFVRFREIQQNEIARLFPRTAEAILGAMNAIRNLPPAKGKIWEKAADILEHIPSLPEINDRDSIAPFIAACTRLNGVSLPGNTTDETLVELKEILSVFKKKQYPEFLSLANAVLNDAFIEETFHLLGKFQTLFHGRKRKAGIMTFADVSRLAVDALIADPALRLSYKEAISAIMIDEFQDDNEMQRNLLFLIAEQKERTALSVPEAGELCPDKLFFVGDEKQSIYRFRGADVSVFRELSRDLAFEGSPQLDTNYRTEKPLIDIFNAVFPFVFMNSSFYTQGAFPPYEASFNPISASRHTKGIDSGLDVLLINEDNFTAVDGYYLDAAETEAAEVASRIRDMVDTGYLIRGSDGKSPCVWGDIAILFRSGTKQRNFEKHLRENDIPYQAESLRGLFSDAPVNDIYALLRLAVYPADNTAYAMLLRSPFVTIGDRGFTLALMARADQGIEDIHISRKPFPEGLDPSLDEADRERFQRGRQLYLDIQDKADRMSASDIITYLWYTIGYRYAVLSDAETQRYAELYDYFFELARQSDLRGETLATFLERIASLMATGEKIEGLDIPVERSGGVKLMTVHKSKGLEFPVVFLVDCGNNGNPDKNTAPVYFSEETGLSVNTGGAEESEEARSNWFYEKSREEEKNKAQAEIRRLVYVAMTRAETRLCISGTVKLGAEPSDAGRTDAEIRASISAWLDKKDERADKEKKPVSKRSFFDFLLPAFNAADIPGVTMSEILPRERNKGTPSRKQVAGPAQQEKIVSLYEKTPLAEYEITERTRYSATALHGLAAEGKAMIEIEEIPESPPDALDLQLKKTGTLAADFGSFAHQTIEARFTGFPAFMPEELRGAAELMADCFFSSDLGKKSLEASWRENEYGFITHYDYYGKKLTITGQIDLIFEHGGTLYIVDYKTDKTENPALHAEQLAVYRKAAKDLRGSEAETWLFYLRSGRAIRVS